MVPLGIVNFLLAHRCLPAQRQGAKPDRSGFDVPGTLLLGLTRNLGLITGAYVMGAVFAFAAGTSDTTTAWPEAVAAGIRITFAVAAGLIVVAAATWIGSRVLSTRALHSTGV
jgi:hypothetical protein